MGLLADIFSTADTAKRRLSGLLSDPLGTLALGVTRFGEDQGGLLNMTQNAYPMAGNRTVLNSPQQIANFRKQVADQGTQQAMAGMTTGVPRQSSSDWAGKNTPQGIGDTHASDMMQIIREDIATKDFDPSGVRQSLIDWAGQSSIHPRYSLQAFIRGLNEDKTLTATQKAKIFKAMNP